MYWFYYPQELFNMAFMSYRTNVRYLFIVFGSLTAMLCRDDKAILTGNDNKYTTATFLQSYVKLKAIQNY